VSPVYRYHPATQARARCKRKTCKYAPKCYGHTAVQVRPSSVSGRGLFARTPIRRGDVVADYNFADTLTPDEYQNKRRAGKATHVALVRGKYLDASDTARTIAGMANRAPRGTRNSLKLTQTGKLRATRNVRAGDELFLAYGNAFRMHANR
jgi:hypothetical protein